MAQPLTSAMAEYWAIAIFVLAVIGLCTFMMLASWLLGGRSSGPNKGSPFESGIVGTSEPRQRFSVKFYLVAMLFVIFDIEAVYLFAWAVSLPESGWIGFWAAAIFIFILLAGLLYDSRTGALDWAPSGAVNSTRTR